MNILPCVAGKGEFRLEGHRAGRCRHDKPASQLGIRPEHIAVVPKGEGHMDGLVEVAEYLGADTFLYVSAKGMETLTVRIEGSAPDHEGEEVGLRFDEDCLHFFDEAGEIVRG
jgi:multiple sugar transport system ATP-binding protein